MSGRPQGLSSAPYPYSSIYIFSQPDSHPDKLETGKKLSRSIMEDFWTNGATFHELWYGTTGLTIPKIQERTALYVVLMPRVGRFLIEYR